MSKALRIVTEDLLPHPTLFSNWHPFYAVMNGSNPSCFLEFMEIIKCLENKKPSECNKQYNNLLQCLKNKGFE